MKFLYGLSIFTLVMACIHWLIKSCLVLKIYHSHLNVDNWFKFWFSVEGMLNPFGLVFMRYSLFSLPVYSWENNSPHNWFFDPSKSYYARTIFPEIKSSGSRKLLVVSNLGFSYLSVPSYLKKIYKYICSLELVSKKWEKYLYRQEDQQIIKNISFSISSGKFVAIVGKNGSGKSTIAKIIVHLLSHYEGRVLWSGQELQNISIKSFAQNVSYIPQQSIIYHDISLFDFISIGFFPKEGILLKKLKKEDKEERIRRVLKELNLEKEASKSLYALSGGNRQKAIIARSIIQGAKIIVLDEPLNFLDIKSKMLVLEYLKFLQLKQGVTIIMIHHDIGEIKQYIDEIVVIDNGFLARHIKLENLRNRQLEISNQL